MINIHCFPAQINAAGIQGLLFQLLPWDPTWAQTCQSQEYETAALTTDLLWPPVSHFFNDVKKMQTSNNNKTEEDKSS